MQIYWRRNRLAQGIPILCRSLSACFRARGQNQQGSSSYSLLSKTASSPNFHRHSNSVRHTSSSNLGTATRVYLSDVFELHVQQLHRHQPRMLQRRLEVPRSHTARRVIHSLTIPSQTSRYIRLSKECSETAPLATPDSMPVRFIKGLAKVCMRRRQRE